MKKFLIVLVSIIVIACAGIGIYTHTDKYEQMATHFANHTMVNGVDCSNMTVEEAEAALTEKWQSESFVIKQDGASSDPISLKHQKFDIEDSLQSIIGTNFFDVMKKHASVKKKEKTIPMTLAGTKYLRHEVAENEFVDVPYKTKTKNAYVNLDNRDFKIVKEVYGDNIDIKKVTRRVAKKIENGKFTLDFTPSKFYEKPTLKADDAELLDEQKFDKDHYSQKITLQEYNKNWTIAPKYLKQMNPPDGSGGTKIDEEGIEDFVNKVEAWEINTQYAPIKFKSTDQGTITVPGGTYGYVIDKKAEIKQITKDVKSGKDVTRKPTYKQTPYYTGGGMNDVGDSYIEVSISSQSLWLYKKGKQVLATSVVTGKPGHDTGRGVFFIAYKQLNATLRGNNDDGSNYESKVNYWMPFNGGQGCHDADWRGSFGGGIYLSDGSHGCVNMPPWAAASLYSSIEANFPIVVHD